MKAFWDERYREMEYAYGEEANVFFKERLRSLHPGKLLLPADGEGRNGVFAAELGWEVTSFDYSISARDKALDLAKRRGVEVNYIVGAFDEMDFAPESFDVIALIFAHFPPAVRKQYHRRVVDWLRPGGTIILEAFSPDHLEFQRTNSRAGGPSNIDLLYTPEILESDFEGLTFQCIEAMITRLEEGNYHVGQSAVVRMVASKPK